MCAVVGLLLADDLQLVNCHLFSDVICSDGLYACLSMQQIGLQRSPKQATSSVLVLYHCFWLTEKWRWQLMLRLLLKRKCLLAHPHFEPVTKLRFCNSNGGGKNSETWKALKGILKPLWLRTVSEALHFNFLLILAMSKKIRISNGLKI